MAGVRNQARLAAQLRLRRQVARQDELVRSYFAAEATVEQAERKLAAVRLQCESRLRRAESARDDSARALAAVLAEVAAELGEDRAAEILEVPLSRVRTARRSSPKSQQGKSVLGDDATGAAAEKPASVVQGRDLPAGRAPRKTAGPAGGVDDGSAGASRANDSGSDDDGRA